MKKKIQLNLFFLISLFFLTSCSNIPNSSWTKINKRELFLDLKPGDILIKEKEFTIYGVFGHAALMKNNRYLIDYPMIGETSYEVPITYWLERNRDIIILRYKYMTEKFLNRLLINIDKYQGYPYSLTFNKKKSNGFYCSQYIWFVYYITAKELGFHLDLDSNDGFLILPYDFYNSKYLINIKTEEN